MAEHRLLALTGFLCGALLAPAWPARAQVVPCSATEASPNLLPPAGSPALVRCIEVVFHPEGTQSVDSETYNYYIKPLEPSLRSQNKWVTYNEEQAIAAFSRLMRTSFLDDCWVEVIDEPYENGVMGKHVIFHLEERRRLKGIEFSGSTVIESASIWKALNDRGVLRSTGGFVPEDYVLIRQVRKVIKDLYAEQGYPNAVVIATKSPVPGNPNLVSLMFDIQAGSKSR
jgi:outer membrane protein assembly factor BamA